MWYDIAFGIIIGLIFISLIILFCVVLAKLYIRKINNYNKVIYQKDLDFQKTLTTTVIETQEQVLNNISQDLHDDAGQQLTYINFQLEKLKLDAPELQETFAPISESVDNLSKSIRSISHSLNNHLLTQQNLLKAIETETRRLRKNGRITIQFTLEDDKGKTFDSHEKIIVYRIFQEIMSNIFKHSRAKSVQIDIRTNPGFMMTIRDNGKGFDFGNIKNTTLGLQGMANRAEIIAYTLDVQSIPDEGTTIILSEKQI
ncbi:MAG TPA: histidine kinase [Flavobacterium sp.]|nr:histidine kinase [Flavobacterium sp.]